MKILILILNLATASIAWSISGFGFQNKSENNFYAHRLSSELNSIFSMMSEMQQELSQNQTEYTPDDLDRIYSHVSAALTRAQSPSAGTLTYFSLSGLAAILSSLRELEYELARNASRYTQNDLQYISAHVEAALKRAANPSTVRDVEVVRACKRVFGDGPVMHQCISGAKSGLVVYTCGEIFGSGALALQCSTEALTPEVIRACSRLFGSGALALNCSQNVRDPAVVQACSAFGSGSTALDCAQNAHSAWIVQVCTRGFDSGTLGLECSKFAKNAARVQHCLNTLGSGRVALNCAIE